VIDHISPFGVRNTTSERLFASQIVGRVIFAEVGPRTKFGNSDRLAIDDLELMQCGDAVSPTAGCRSAAR